MQKEPAIVEPDDTKPRLILQSKSGELTYIEDGDPLAEILSNQQYPSLRNFSFKFESPEAQIQIPQTIPVSCNDMPYAHGPPPHKKQIIQHISPPHVPVRSIKCFTMSALSSFSDKLRLSERQISSINLNPRLNMRL